MSAAPPFEFKSRRAISAGLVAGPQAPADRTAGEGESAPAAPFRPFRAYVLAYASRRQGHLHPILSTLSVKRSKVKDAFCDFYRDREAGNRQWARALKSGARITRVVVTADPDFDFPKGAI